MGTEGGAQLGGLLFGCVVASLMFWLGVAALPFARPAAVWFQRHLDADTTLTALGSKQAAKKMSSGQIVFAAVAALVISAIILVNAGSEVGAASSATVPIGIFLGCGALVGGGVLLVRAAKRLGRGAGVGVIVGVVLSLIGVGLAVAAVVVGFSA